MRLHQDLSGLGLNIRSFSDINECIETCADEAPDLLVIAFSSPEGGGAVRQLRQAWQTQETHLLLVVDPQAIDELTVNDQVDDIILTTYDLKELRVRLQLILSKLGHQVDDKIVIGKMTIDSKSYEVKVDDHTVPLTYREYELLRFLASQRGRVFTRKVLVENIWQYDYLSGTRTVDVHVRRLRSKLGPQYGALIETVRNVGYRFSRTNPADNRTNLI